MDLPVINNGEPLERQRLAEQHQRLTAWQLAQRRADSRQPPPWNAMRRLLRRLSPAFMDEFPASDLPSRLKGTEREFAAGEVDVVRVVELAPTSSSTAALALISSMNSRDPPQHWWEQLEFRLRALCDSISLR
ncbi:MAG: hypothetical protein U0936_23720 [Planctomycetaceae bacterium]